MNNASSQSETQMRTTLLMPNYFGISQLMDVLRQIDDTITTIDGLYTQLALIETGNILDALSYEEDARSYLKEHYYTAIHAVSHQQIGDDHPFLAFNHYPFASLSNPLLEFNRKTLGKYPVSLQPLTLAAISMGSINIDFLGVGKILEFIEHAVKQIQWEAHHEKGMALLEEQLLEQRVIETHLTNEEKRLSIASKRIELFNVIQNLDLPLNQRQKLVKSIVDKVDHVSVMADIKIIEKK